MTNWFSLSQAHHIWQVGPFGQFKTFGKQKFAFFCQLSNYTELTLAVSSLVRVLCQYADMNFLIRWHDIIDTVFLFPWYS